MALRLQSAADLMSLTKANPKMSTDRLPSFGMLIAHLSSAPWRCALVALTLTACGGPSTSSSGVDPSANILSISEQDQKLFCDWKASLYSGYGNQRLFNCPNGQSGVLKSDADQTTCLRFFQPIHLSDEASRKARCSITVEQAEECESSVLTDPCAPVTIECIRYIGCHI